MLTRLWRALQRYLHGAPIEEWRFVDDYKGMGPFMRAKRDGRWFYRPMTPDEMRDYAANTIW